MGTIILLIAFVIEAVFVVYCIATKSYQKAVRSYIRIGALAAFVLFVLLGVLHWAFRWYLLALLLLIWAVLGAATLVRKQPEAKAYKAWVTVGRGMGMLALMFIAVLPALIFPPFSMPQVTGAHSVATALFSYANPDAPQVFPASGEKPKVNIECWYPADAAGGEKFPLVLFSHGSFGLKTSNGSTFKELASNGYVVCSIDHAYIAAFTRDDEGKMVTFSPTFRQEFYAVNGGKYDTAAELKLGQQWMGLVTSNINLVLDTILAKAKDPASEPVYQLVDPQKIGLMGHSLGGESSALVARQRIASGKNDISAVVNLDADLAGEYTGVVNGREVLTTTVYTTPILTILSYDLAQRIAALPDADQRVAVQAVTRTAPHAYEIVFPGTNHMSFTDLALASPPLTAMLNNSVGSNRGSGADSLATLEKMNALILRFYNAFLKGDGTFSVADP